eukprot:CAMPEP_0202855518 /NCGR_PEP_ID=MMETSP1389-20130828/91553_1 /ASSEMBLY_ACC=CAM_ASM_000865 /TAXON_ID=302021 /ORGANISM="Rhodomonas sp., Strain CCMP768" /LENGTH=218 /DNA_ID=CAMNT_0049534129 /DNA_START=40 /DNA_END=694 /DNA_ORIENTATION=+
MHGAAAYRKQHWQPETEVQQQCHRAASPSSPTLLHILASGQCGSRSLPLPVALGRGTLQGSQIRADLSAACGEGREVEEGGGGHGDGAVTLLPALPAPVPPRLRVSVVRGGHAAPSDSRPRTAETSVSVVRGVLAVSVQVLEHGRHFGLKRRRRNNVPHRSHLADAAPAGAAVCAGGGGHAREALALPRALARQDPARHRPGLLLLLFRGGEGGGAAD